ncbi:MAG: stage II sporulation protein M [Chloroflexota bacterium]
MGFKKCLLLASMLFCLGLVLGLLTPLWVQGLLEETLGELFEEFGDISALPDHSFAVLVFTNNIRVVLTGFVFAPFLCLLPVLSLVLNGWLVSVVSIMAIPETSLGYIVAGLLPHGIIEIPAVILAQAAAINFGVTVISALFRPEKRPLLLPSLKQNARYVGIACSLLLPAALIETYVTPLLMALYK